MKPTNEDRLILAILLSCLLLAYIGLSGVQHPENNPGNDWLAWIDHYSGGLQAMFDAALVVIGCLQWQIYKNMRNDSVAKDRACVFVESWNYVSTTRPHDQRIHSWRFNPIFRNSGNTIAEKTISFVSGYALSEIAEKFLYPDRGEDRKVHPYIIGPRSSTQGGFVKIPVPVLVAAQKNMWHVYVWGWIEYKDTFNPDYFHRFEFCNEIIPRYDLRDRNCGFSFPYVSKHNGEDDDCLRKAGERGPLEPITWPWPNIQAGQFEEFGLPEPTSTPDLFTPNGTPKT